MQKKGLLALLLAVTVLLFSGCALVTVDEDVDDARTIIDVNGETVTKGVLNNAAEYQIQRNEYMNQLYSTFGMSGSYPTDLATVRSQLVESYIENLVSQQKAAAGGFDQLTAEEEADVQAQAKEAYDNEVKQVIDSFFANSELKDEELTVEAEKYIADNGFASLEQYVESYRKQKAVEKLRADAIKDVTVTDEEIAALLTEKVEADKESFASAPDSYGYSVNNGTTTYYAPAGYRYVKQILVKFLEEDSTAVSQAQTALTTAQSALTNAAEDADKDALQKAVDDAKAALDAANATAQANIQEKTDEIYAKATAEDADFDALVKEYNEDTGMPERGYAVREGYVYFVASFTDAAMKLENVGDVSEPTASSYGFHILKYTEDIPEGAVALDSVRDTLHAELLASKQDEAYKAALQTWISEANVKTYLDRLN